MNDVITGRKIRSHTPDNPANRKNLDSFEMDIEYGNVMMDEVE